MLHGVHCEELEVLVEVVNVVVLEEADVVVVEVVNVVVLEVVDVVVLEVVNVVVFEVVDVVVLEVVDVVVVEVDVDVVTLPSSCFGQEVYLQGHLLMCSYRNPFTCESSLDTCC